MNRPTERRTSEAYRGYLIRWNGDYVWIEKGGFHVSSPATVEAARKAIDELTGGAK